MILFTSPAFEQHVTGDHPENPFRLTAIAQRLQKGNLLSRCEAGTSIVAERNWLTAVHDQKYLDRVQKLAENGGGRIDPDTVVSPKSWDIAQLAAGTACAAVQQVINQKDTRAMCLLRPPGHHALRDRGMGFCLMNNVAVAARFAQNVCGLRRILIVDWDVHHGNGTQDLFYDDGAIHFFSIHRSPFYPGTGAAEETGTGAGLGATTNIPVHLGISRPEFLKKFRQGLDSALEKCRPELILISAGFDAHRLDPIGSLGLETEDFGVLTDLVLQGAAETCGGRVVSLLEGGYHPDALAASVELHLEQMTRSESAP